MRAKAKSLIVQLMAPGFRCQAAGQAFRGFEQKDLRAFPVAVRSEIGQSLFEAQLGDAPAQCEASKGFSGVLEIRDNFDGDAYRTV